MTDSFQKHQRGAVATEFILAVPFFLVLVFTVMEVSFMWVDKHFLRLASFEAARVLIASSQTNPCEDEESMKDARAVAILRMAAVASSVGEVFRENRLSVQWDGFGEDDQSKIGKAAAHILERIPAATVLTGVKCNFDVQTQLVEVNVKYQRSPKMPLVKHIMWGLYVLSHLGYDYFEMDGTYYNLRSAKNLVAQPIGDLRNVLTNWKGDVESAAAMIDAGDFVGGTDAFVVASAWTNVLSSGLSKAEKEMAARLDATGKVVTAVIYAMPESLRLIPMQVKVSLRKNFYNRKGNEWKNGRAVVIAPFTISGQESAWYKWIRKLQDEPVDW